MTVDYKQRLLVAQRREVEVLEHSVKVYRGLADEYESRLAAARDRLNRSEQNERTR